jgi:hypothetical protein
MLALRLRVGSAMLTPSEVSLKSKNTQCVTVEFIEEDWPTPYALPTTVPEKSQPISTF